MKALQSKKITSATKGQIIIICFMEIVPFFGCE
jgi:hypothetical protein